MRIEFTLLDEKLLSPSACWQEGEPGLLYFCTSYEDAISPPFPIEGKDGISIWVGPLKAFHHPRARLLWELEKKRKRPAAIVLTEQKGRSFMRSYREVGSVLGDQLIAPLCFLRRRGKLWDSLDFCSAGGTSFMDGADIRLKRLKQAGWEYLVDRICLNNKAIKEEYFSNLFIARARLIQASALHFSQLKLSPLMGIAGMGINKGTIFSLLSEPLIAQQLIAPITPSKNPDKGKWLFLSHRQQGSLLVLLGSDAKSLAVGDVLKSSPADKAPSSSKALSLKSAEFAVAEVRENIRLASVKEEEWMDYCEVRVDWRYPPGREIPTLWERVAEFKH